MHSFISIAKQKQSEELLEIIYELDKWDPQMLEACENELKARDILPEDFIEKRNQVINQEEVILASGSQASMTGIIIGWLGILGLIGIYIGYHYTNSKVQSKYTGKYYFKYNEDSRKDGTYIFYSSIFGSIIALIYTVIKLNNT